MGLLKASPALAPMFLASVLTGAVGAPPDLSPGRMVGDSGPSLRAVRGPEPAPHGLPSEGAHVGYRVAFSGKMESGGKQKSAACRQSLKYG